MEKPTVKIKLLSKAASTPKYQTPGAVGMDLHACLQKDGISEEVEIRFGYQAKIPTGLSLQVPDGWEAQVRPRSGLASKGLSVANSPGTIDPDYRGEVQVILENRCRDTLHTIRHGDRIAQLVIVPAVQATIEEVDELDETERGEGGFGSTGVKEKTDGKK